MKTLTFSCASLFELWRFQVLLFQSRLWRKKVAPGQRGRLINKTKHVTNFVARETYSFSCFEWFTNMRQIVTLLRTLRERNASKYFMWRHFLSQRLRSIYGMRASRGLGDETWLGRNAALFSRWFYLLHRC